MMNKKKVSKLKINHHKLKKKGWSDEEINHAQNIITLAEERKHPKLYLFEKTTYWFLFSLIILVGITAAWIIQPITISVKSYVAYFIVIVMGILFSSFSIILIRLIEKLERHHYVLISVIIPLTAITSSIIITQKINLVAKLTNLYTHNPYLIGTLFGIFSLIPYLLYLYLEVKTKNGPL